jgi:WD40 repeat protein
LAGCLDFDPRNTISWSPDGARVAFLSQGKAWIYTLDTGAATPLSEESYLSLSWSPKGDWLAVSTAAYVEAYHEENGVFVSSLTFSTRLPESDVTTLMWHPDGRRLLYSEVAKNTGITTEVDVATGAVSHPGEGIGLYGPGGGWLLWAAPMAVGRRGEAMHFERQTSEGGVLPLKEAELDEDRFFTVLPGLSDFAESPLCFNTGSEYSCFTAAGALQKKAPVPENSMVFADRGRGLFAVFEKWAEDNPELKIIDERGRVKADGAKFLKAISENSPPTGGDEQRTVQVSRLAWSPDGNWLAWVVEGRLCLWNWRNDETRIHASPDLP